jgi:2-polyprenyl-3-methyl-5-hydroxy-6-metoxy-1,4-benzoquinol methylase
MKPVIYGHQVGLKKFFVVIQFILDNLEKMHPYVLPYRDRRIGKTKSVNWNSYFYSRLHPIGHSWEKRDLELYKKWYYMWFVVINKIIPIYGKNKASFEIGSGIGSVAALLKERGVNIIGSDISREMISIAKKLIPNVQFVYFDVTKNTPGKNLFDFIYAFEVLEHISEPTKAIKTIYSLLTKRGIFIGSCPYPFIKNFEDRTHISMFTPEKWETLLKKQGFNTVQTIPMTFFPFFWRISKYLNIPLPFYTTFSRCVSTILIIARK